MKQWKKILGLGLSLCMVCSLIVNVTQADAVTANNNVANQVLNTAVPFTSVNNNSIDKTGTKYDINKFGLLKEYEGMDKEVIVPDGVKTIAAGAFFTNNYMESLKLPDSVTRIGDHCFKGCGNLVNIELSSNLTTIGSSTFRNCVSCASIEIPSSVTSIGDWAFKGCTSLSALEISPGITSMGKDVFAETPWLENKRAENPLVIVNDIVVDGKCCTGAVVIPEGVKYIAKGAFEQSKVTSLKIPSSLVSIDAETFSGSWLKYIEVSEDNPVYDSRENCNAIIETASNTLVLGCDNTTIPEGIKTIGKYAFYCDYGLKKIEMPDSVENIGEYAFFHCAKLEDIKLSSGIKNIGYAAFSGSKWLENMWENNQPVIINGMLVSGWNCSGNIEIPDSVTTILEGAFANNKDLQSVIIPDSVTTIEGSAFYNCCSLASVEISDNVTSIGKYAFNSCSSLVEIRIPQSVTFIGGDAFDKTPWIENKRVENPLVIINDILVDGKAFKGHLEVPEGVTQIAGYSFYSNDALTGISMPSSVTSIGYRAFDACVNVYRLRLSEGLEVIEEQAFGSMSNGIIHIPVSVTSIGKNAFCSAEKYAPIIYGYAGSYAETYAKENEYEFVDKVAAQNTGIPSGNVPSISPVPNDPSESQKPNNTPSTIVKDKTFYDIDGTEGINLSDALAVLKCALGITQSEEEYNLSDALMCLKIALGIVVLE